MGACLNIKTTAGGLRLSGYSANAESAGGALSRTNCGRGRPGEASFAAASSSEFVQHTSGIAREFGGASERHLVRGEEVNGGHSARVPHDPARAERSA